MPAAGKDASVVGRRPVLMPVGPGAKPRDDSGVYGRCDPARGLPLRLAQQRRVQGVPALAVGGHEQAGPAPAGGLVGCAVDAEGDADGLAVQPGCPPLVQIGSTSCMGRVWQYLLVGVLTVS